MEPEDIGVIWDTIDPSFNWEDQEALWDLSLPSYHPETVFRTQIEALKARGVLSETYDTQAGLEEFLLAQEIYYDLKDMQDRSDDLFAESWWHGPFGQPAGPDRSGPGPLRQLQLLRQSSLP